MSFPRYPSYKDSGVEWLGEVPGHWKVLALKHHFQIIGGSTPKSDTDSFWDGDILWATPSDLSKRDTVYLNDTVRKITAAGLASCGTTLVPARSIVLSTRAPIGSLAIAEREMCTNQGCKSLVPSSNVSTEYFAYMLSISSTELNIRGKGTTFLELSGDELGAFIVPAPPALEQTQIAAFLDRETAKIDALVAEQRRLMELLKEKRQAVISHAVTKGLNPNAPMKRSGIDWLGDVPEHWEVTAVKRFTDTVTDGAHISPDTENGVFHFVSTKDVYDDSIDFENALLTSKTSFDYMVRSGCRPQVGDVLFSKDGTIGRTVVVQEDREFVVASSLIIIRPTKSTLDSDFLNCLCQSRVVASQVESLVKGAGLPRLSIQNLVKVFGCFPPLDEQIAVATFLKVELANFGALAAEAQRAIDLLQERRTALISAAVTGQIDVRGEPRC
jgi:type I restriction enzyme S subunit